MTIVSTYKATLWAIFDRFSTQIVAFIIGIVLARLLTPQDYGIIGMTTIFIAISNVFIDSGFGNALIRKYDRSENDLSTAFYFNVVLGVITYIIFYISAPFISIFFQEPTLTLILRILGLNIVFLSFSIVQTALLTAKLNIRILTIINLLSLIPAGILAIIAAYIGWGIYALVIQAVLSSFLKMVLLWIFSKWYPKSRFHKDSFNYLWSFGSKLLTANIIGTIFNEIYSLLIGKYIGKVDLGYYSKASHLNQNVNGTTSGIVQKITLPILSLYQNNNNELRNRFRHLMSLLCFFISPLTTILFFLAEDIIIILWSEKWINCVPIFQLLILGTLFNPISQMSLALLQVVNRTDIILKLELPKKISYCILIIIGFQYGVIGLAFIQIIINIIAALFNMYPLRKLLSYGYGTQFIDIFKYIFYSFTIGLLLDYCLEISHPILQILTYILLFISIYLIVLYFIKDKFVFAKVNNLIKKS